MKRAAVFAAGVALAASTVIATPTFGATRDPCTVLQRQLDKAQLRLARHGLDSKAGSRAQSDIITIRLTARELHCHLT